MRTLATATYALSIVVAIELGASSASAFCRLTTTAATVNDPCPEDGVPLEWKRRCISYAIDGRGSAFLSLDEIRTAIDASFQAWLEVTCESDAIELQIQETEGASQCIEAEFIQRGRNVNTFAFVDDWEDRSYDPNAFALTTVFHNRTTGEILDADMQFNEQQGPFDICPVPSCLDGDQPNAVDLQNVATHEIGHFFGLGHSNFGPATMFGTSFRGETSKRALTSDDVEGICTIYPPGSLSSECDFTPYGGLDLNCEDADNGVPPGCAIGATDRLRGLWLVLLALWLVNRGQRERADRR